MTLAAHRAVSPNLDRHLSERRQRVDRRVGPRGGVGGRSQLRRNEPWGPLARRASCRESVAEARTASRLDRLD